MLGNKFNDSRDALARIPWCIVDPGARADDPTAPSGFVILRVQGARIGSTDGRSAVVASAAMKVALLYPPTWIIPAAGEEASDRSTRARPSASTGNVAGGGDAGDGGPTSTGAPAEYQEGDLDADFFQIPYGLLSLGAQAIRAGHSVKVLNLSNFSWKEVERVVRDLAPDVLALSCWTANRRGVGYVAALAKKLHPNCHVVVGGPHATPLGAEMLAFHPSIDTICVGESDVTFLELLHRLETSGVTRGIAGTIYREAGPGSRIVHGPKRANITDLDTLAAPQDYFPTHILMTSRGCPWSCTFCGAETSWGRGFRSNSNDYIIASIRAALGKLPVQQIQIKDDTFTTNKKRVRELCQRIRDEKIQFLWSCDTRVDVLDEPLLREMRLAGCQRLSLGVETGSQAILDRIEKKITTEEIRAATVAAKNVGIKVRWYMMLGNRGETVESFEETRRFIEAVRPHEYIFSCLSIYPGTKDFHDAEKSWLDRKVYFTGDFQELKTPFDCDERTLAVLDAFFRQNKGLRTMHSDGVAEYRAIADRLGPHHAASMDLAASLYHAGEFDEAEQHVQTALALGWPAPGLAYNHLAAIAKARGDVDGMKSWFLRAAKEDPQHWVLVNNMTRVRDWLAAEGRTKNLPLFLDVRHDFQLLERPAQPTLPGPLAADFAVWSEPSAAHSQAATESPGHEGRGQLQHAWVKTPDQEGSGAPLRKRLPVT